MILPPDATTVRSMGEQLRPGGFCSQASRHMGGQRQQRRNQFLKVWTPIPTASWSSSWPDIALAAAVPPGNETPVLQPRQGRQGRVFLRASCSTPPGKPKLPLKQPGRHGESARRWRPVRCERPILILFWSLRVGLIRAAFTLTLDAAAAKIKWSFLPTSADPLPVGNTLRTNCQTACASIRGRRPWPNNNRVNKQTKEVLLPTPNALL